MSDQPQPLPHFGLAYVQRGDAAAAQGDHRQAAADYCRAIAHGVADASVYERLAAAFAEAGDATQAVKALDAAIHLEPARWACHVRAGELSERAGWLNRARRYWEALATAAGFEDLAREGLARVAAGLARTGLEGIDPPGAPPEQATLEGFAPPQPQPRAAAPKGRPGGRFAGPPPPLEDLASTPAPSVRKGGLAPDGFGTSARAADYLEEFREPPAPQEPAAPAPEGSKLEQLRAKLEELRD